MTNMFRRAAAAVLIAVCAAAALSGCGGSASKADPPEIWSTYNTEKVLRNEGRRADGAGEMVIRAFRGEKEGGQIILTAKEAVSAFTVTPADLTAEGETPVKLSRDCFSVYLQKYIEVTDRTTQELPAGWYPDALLPFEAAAAAGENAIAAGDNQGVWITLAVPENQPAGVYKGSFAVDTDGTVTYLPVTVEIWDGTVGAESHLRTVFSVHRYWGNGGIITAELDSSWEMYRAYYDFLKDYRINTRYLPASMKDEDGFIREALRYAADPAVTTFVIPYLEKYDSAAKQNGIDYDYYERLIRRMGDESIESGINLFEKAVTYFALFDEAVLNKTVYMANTILGKVKAIHNKIAAELTARKAAGDKAVKQEYIDDLTNIVNLFVDEYTAELTADNATYCPLVREYDTPASRALYEADEEKWWYTCVSPKTPYPTYHIDDHLYSSRIMSWMQYEYGVTGNLYWSTTYYRTSYGPDTLQDYYDTAMRFSGANGDGFLLYPGKPYGIYGPVGTLRLEGIRDGMEDYEILYALGRRYAEIADAGTETDLNSVLQHLYRRLYSGTRVGTTSAAFAATRERLAKLYIAAEKTGAAIIKAEEQSGTIGFTVFAPDGVEVRRGGELLTGTAAPGGKTYTLTADRTEEENVLALAFVKEGASYEVSLDLGGKRVEFAGETLLPMLTAADEGGALSLDDGSASGAGETTVKASLPALTDSTPAVLFDPGLPAGETEKKKLTLRVYNPGAAMRFTCYVRGAADRGVLFEAGRTTLSPGWNLIEADLSRLNWKLIGAFDEFVLSVGEKGGTARTIYLSSARFE